MLYAGITDWSKPSVCLLAAHSPRINICRPPRGSLATTATLASWLRPAYLLVYWTLGQEARHSLWVQRCWVDATQDPSHWCWSGLQMFPFIATDQADGLDLTFSKDTSLVMTQEFSHFQIHPVCHLPAIKIKGMFLLGFCSKVLEMSLR